jgi:hypothetical protein
MKKIKNKDWKKIHEEALTWARWMALYEAINYLGDKADDKGVKFDTLDLKPLKILDYIEATQDILLRKLLKLDYNIDVCYSEMDNVDELNYYKKVEGEYVY